ncbi:hypothetical protein BDF21DRAFT_456830 [Thamnidium elegans]|nr:hypothetical protein BDF21DRAFT_456830 [Thamnidium elegans]
MVKTIKGLLKKICDQYQGSWVDWLPAACYVVRTNVYFGHGFTPFFLLHGRQHRSNNRELGEEYLQDLPMMEATISQDTNEEAFVEETSDEIDILVQRLEEIIQLNESIIPDAISSQSTIKLKQAAQFNLKHRTSFRKYRIEDTVMMRNNATDELSADSLGVTWLGPFRIDKILPRDVYILADGRLRLPIPVHANNIKKYRSRPRDNPLYRKWAVDSDPLAITKDSPNYLDNVPSPVIRKRRRQEVFPPSN